MVDIGGYQNLTYYWSQSSPPETTISAFRGKTKVATLHEVDNMPLKYVEGHPYVILSSRMLSCLVKLLSVNVSLSFEVITIRLLCL